MHIINLTETQYMNYANIHNTKSFGQTIEYSKLAQNKLFLGLIDEHNNIYAAVLLIIKNISPSVKEAYAKAQKSFYDIISSTYTSSEDEKDN